MGGTLESLERLPWFWGWGCGRLGLGRPAEALVISGATLIEGTGSAPVANSVIVLQNGRISALGPDGSVQAPRFADIKNTL